MVGIGRRRTASISPGRAIRPVSACLRAPSASCPTWPRRPTPPPAASSCSTARIKQFGGTSWSAPTWAGFAALINEARAASGAPSLGLLNPLIYPLIGTANFRDIVKGSNGPTGSDLYDAGPGFDETTGIGSPDVDVLIQTLSSNSTSTVLAINNFSPASGAPGQAVTIRGTAARHRHRREFRRGPRHVCDQFRDDDHRHRPGSMP